jgi:hypothetical protein
MYSEAPCRWPHEHLNLVLSPSRAIRYNTLNLFFKRIEIEMPLDCEMASGKEGISQGDFLYVQ